MKDYGFSSNKSKLNQIMNDLLEQGKLQFINKILIVDDNYKQFIDETGLSKAFYKYKNTTFTQGYLVSEYQKMLEQQRLQKEEEQAREKQERIKLQQDQEEVNKLKDQFKGHWVTQEEVNQSGISYFNWHPAMEYYWSCINNKYYIGKDGVVYIPQELYNNIYTMNVGGLKGSTFLQRSYKMKNRYGSKRITISHNEENAIDTNQPYGVYGIFYNDKLIYVGSTMRPFEKRFQEHKTNILMKSNELNVYKLINDINNVEFRILIDVQQLKTNKILNRSDIESMELALITIYQPEGNLAGRVTEFQYRDERKK